MPRRKAFRKPIQAGVGDIAEYIRGRLREVNKTEDDRQDPK